MSAMTSGYPNVHPELGHVVEVHAVDRRDHGGNGEQGDDRREKVVVDVAEVGADLVGDELVLAACEAVDGVDEWARGPVELQHLALEVVDALGRVGAIG
jgi:hypothetical protein